MAMVCSAVLVVLAGRCVHDHDAGPRRRRQVDVVHADPGTNDDLQALLAVEQFGRELRSAADDDPVRLLECLPHLLRRQPGPHIGFDLRVIVQQLQAGWRQVIGNQHAVH